MTRIRHGSVFQKTHSWTARYHLIWSFLIPPCVRVIKAHKSLCTHRVTEEDCPRRCVVQLGLVVPPSHCTAVFLTTWFHSQAFDCRTFTEDLARENSDFSCQMDIRGNKTSTCESWTKNLWAQIPGLSMSLNSWRQIPGTIYSNNIPSFARAH